MGRHPLLSLLVLCFVCSSVSAQSLSDLAKKEKERRKKNQEKGEQVLVITESELEEGRRESTPPGEGSTESPSTDRRSPQTRNRSTRPSEGAVDEGDESGIPTEIPRNAELREKIAIFERMLAAHRQEIQSFDAEIAKNNARIEEIQQELNTIGAGGLPVAPQADRTPRYEGAAPGLRSEQETLRQRNRELEALKRRKANELRDKGRRAGIPAGYLRF